jgi:hypothetical protein
MKEDFLHYIWKNQLFNKADLRTVNGERISIIDVGNHNTNAGPDFLNAKIKIENLTWVGNVEIHVNSSDWIRHKHQNDKAYNNVILHLVYNDDKVLDTERGDIPQTLELSNRLDIDILTKYKKIFNQKESVLCTAYLSSIDDKLWKETLQKLVVERFRNKVNEVEESLSKTTNDLEWVLFSFLAQSLGLKVNKQSMQMLAQSISIKILRKYQKNEFQLFYSKIKYAISYKKIKELLNVELDEYWNTHYVFNKSSINKKKQLGDSTLDVIIINAIVPLYYLIGEK